MANPYKVGIELSVLSDHARVLGALSSGLRGVVPHINELIGHFGRLKAAISGALTIGVGTELLSVIEQGIKKTQGLSHELTQLRKLGLTDAEVARVPFAIAGREGAGVSSLASERYQFQLSRAICLMGYVSE
jgi:hypothetical protein